MSLCITTYSTPKVICGDSEDVVFTDFVDLQTVARQLHLPEIDAVCVEDVPGSLRRIDRRLERHPYRIAHIDVGCERNDGQRIHRVHLTAKL
ncbi:MAG: hypothetical protein WEE89_14825 [Gemmatimonadota bacterium]